MHEPLKHAFTFKYRYYYNLYIYRSIHFHLYISISIYLVLFRARKYTIQLTISLSVQRTALYTSILCPHSGPDGCTIPMPEHTYDHLQLSNTSSQLVEGMYIYLYTSIYLLTFPLRGSKSDWTILIRYIFIYICLYLSIEQYFSLSLSLSL